MSIVIKAENISKAYQLGQIGTGTISRDLERWYASLRGKEDPFLRVGESNNQNIKSESEVVWSLKDINFEIEQGDAVGIIGRNGAGKSTLLKILSKVTAPTNGKITGKGRIASLLEVGTGFHPELSGRENIFLNGAILGMRKKEIQRKLEEIVDFAGIERYLDTPVKRYSSGMYVRLAFAVAAHLESEILIVDEVLAVGDAEFQKKCLGKMGEVSKREGRTVLFVSHNMGSVIELCKSAIVLQNGLVHYRGNVTEAVQKYSQNYISETNNIWKSKSTRQNPRIAAVQIQLMDSQPHHKLVIDVTTDSDGNFAPAFIAFDIHNGLGITILQAIPKLEPFIQFDTINKKKSYKLELDGLIPDNYSLSVWIGPHNDHTYDWQREIVSFEIINSPQSKRTFPHSTSNGSIIANCSIII